MAKKGPHAVLPGEAPVKDVVIREYATVIGSLIATLD